MTEFRTNAGTSTAANTRPLQNDERFNAGEATIGDTSFRENAGPPPVPAKKKSAKHATPTPTFFQNNNGATGLQSRRAGHDITASNPHAIAQTLANMTDARFAANDLIKIETAMNLSPSLMQNMLKLAENGWSFRIADDLPHGESVFIANEKVIQLSSSLVGQPATEPLIAAIAMQSAYAASPVQLDWSHPLKNLDSHKVKLADAYVTMNQTLKELGDADGYDLREALGDQVMVDIDAIDQIDVRALRGTQKIHAAARSGYSSVLIGHLALISNVADGIMGPNTQINDNINAQRTLTLAEKRFIFEALPSKTELQVGLHFDVNVPVSPPEMPPVERLGAPISTAPTSTETVPQPDTEVDLDELFGWNELDDLFATQEMRRERAKDIKPSADSGVRGSDFPELEDQEWTELDALLGSFEDRLDHYLQATKQQMKPEDRNKLIDEVAKRDARLDQEKE